MSIDRIKDYLAYDPCTGEFRWIVRPSRRVKAGAIAGRVDQEGYRRIMFQWKSYAASRLAWFFMTGEWPDGLIDHKNLVKTDNSWANLRIATYSQNSQNTPRRSALLKGVAKLPSGKYMAQIKSNRQSYYLGAFATEAEAHRAYVQKARLLHGEFARVN